MCKGAVAINPLAPTAVPPYRGRSLRRKIALVREALLCRVTRVVRNIQVAACLLVASSALGAQAAPPPAAGTMVTVPPYRARLLGVYDFDSGEPIEGVTVVDVLNGASSLTSKTGTVALLFLPDSGSMIRVQKIGYQPVTMVAAISPTDTVPITVLLNRVAQKLDAVVTKDSVRRYLSPALQRFEERRLHNAGGTFISEAALRKSDGRKMMDVMTGAGVTFSAVLHPAPRAMPCRRASLARRR